MSLELAAGALLLLAGLWFASTALFPAGPQARVLSGAGDALSRGLRGVFDDPAVAAPAQPAAFVAGPSAPAVAGPGGRADVSIDMVAMAGDATFMVTLQQTLTALEEVLARLPALLPPGGPGGADGSGAVGASPGGVVATAQAGSSPFGLTVSRLLGESLPPRFARGEDRAASPLLNRLFELCEETLDGADAPDADAGIPGRWASDRAAEVSPAGGPSGDPPEGQTGDVPGPPPEPQEGTPMSNPTEPPGFDVSFAQAGIPAEVAAEMFEVAMTALAQALVDDDRAVREASERALSGVDRDALRRWASAKLLTGSADDTAAAARIVAALELHEVVVEVIGRALDVGSDQRDRAVGALRNLAPTAELLARAADGMAEAQRGRLAALLPELFEGSRLTGLLQVLTADRSEHVRVAALDALAAHADRDTVLRVASQVIATDQSPTVRVVAADLLGRAGTGPGGPVWAPIEPDPALAAEPPAPPLPDDPGRLWELLLDHAGRGELDIVAEAAERDRDLLMAAALAHADDADARARALAVRAALVAGTEDGVVIAVLALADPDPQVRRAAVEVCHRPNVAESATALRRLVTDPDQEVRRAAVDALAASDGDHAAASLVLALADPEDDIRAVARAALQAWGSPAVARVLVDELEVEGGRREAADILRGLGDTGRQAVEAALPDLTPEAVAAVGPVLLAGSGSTERFLADLASLDPRARLRAARALGAIGGPRAVSALVGLLQDPVDDIRIEALDHLGRIGGADIVPVLRRSGAADPIPAVAAAAGRALDRIVAGTDRG